MQLIPLQAIPSQTLNVALNNQQCQLNVYQKFYGLFVDVYVGGELIIGGVIAENLNRIVRSAYLGFAGDLIFADAQGTDNPQYLGLGARFEFLYLTPDDLTTLGLGG